MPPTPAPSPRPSLAGRAWPTPQESLQHLTRQSKPQLQQVQSKPQHGEHGANRLGNLERYDSSEEEDRHTRDLSEPDDAQDGPHPEEDIDEDIDDPPVDEDFDENQPPTRLPTHFWLHISG